MSNRILITGGTGFLAKALIKRLYKDNELVVVARNEGKLIELKQEYPDIEIITGDISDKFVAERACKGVDGIYHLAAFKHVSMAQIQPRECILSNVRGSMNILDMTLKHKPKFIIGISTDKAAQISGVYGATKMLMEKLFEDYEKINPDTKYRVVRYGNILYSTGSVLCKWRENMKQGKPIKLTDPLATRFYWTVDQAVDLIFECLEKAKDARPYIPKMKSIRMNDLLQAMMQKYGEVEVEYIGLQKGENMHEILVDGGVDSSMTPQYTIEEIKCLI